MKYNWYQNAIIYSLDVETFYDSNHDGIGDFQGLIDKLDYLAALGVTCIWLIPFFPSPNRDNGYDIKDYYNIDPRLGCLGDFAQLIDKANVYGIKIIIDLVVNHTSIEHPWFQEARQDRNSKYRNYYVWSDEPVEFEMAELVFPGEENTMWSYDEVAEQYYLHRFYKEQPDLNIMNPDVRDEILKIMGFWLSLGVSGFRIDAAAIIIEPYGIHGAEEKELEKFFEEMRNFLSARKTDAILLAEANIDPEAMPTYMKGVRRMHMLFNFYLNQHLFLALARQNVKPLQDALLKMPAITPDEQWLNFLRQHDELTLEKLQKNEMQEVLEVFGPDPHMQIYNRGIRRRLAPMLNGDLHVLKFCYSILFSLPGVPLIRYGDEIGMGDDLSLEGRHPVRTPMQWSSEPNAGFSKAPQKALIENVIDKGDFSYQKINVLDAQSDHLSLLNWIERSISIRKQCPEIGTAGVEIIDHDNSCLFIHHYKSEHGDLWFVHNFSESTITFNYSEYMTASKRWVHLLGSKDTDNHANSIQLEGFAFHWWRSINK
jgi:maltose alpha-D-glucosyltransferase/alpha-amylase